MHDREQPGESFDEDVLDGEFPPDEPLGADELGGARHEWDSLDDEFTGDETTRDFATERTPRPAEESAMHIEGDGADRRR